jgi:hypothetical protein
MGRFTDLFINADIEETPVVNEKPASETKKIEEPSPLKNAPKKQNLRRIK